MALNHFSKLDAWQLADELETRVVQLVRTTSAIKDFDFRDQLLGCVSGVGSTIAEGFARKSPRDECRFLDFALASLSETEHWLRSGVKRRHFDEGQVAPLLHLAFRVRRATVGYKRHQLEYLRNNSPASKPGQRPVVRLKPIPVSGDGSPKEESRRPATNQPEPPPIGTTKKLR